MVMGIIRKGDNQEKYGGTAWPRAGCSAVQNVEYEGIRGITGSESDIVVGRELYLVNRASLLASDSNCVRALLLATILHGSASSCRSRREKD
jgi:hypothetical protein